MASSDSTTTDDVNPRFTVNDVDDPSAILRPIDGYQNIDKLPLEEAIKKIIPLFQKLERDVWLSKEATKDLKGCVTHDEAAAIYLYTTELEPQSLYTILNELLRAKDRKKLKPWFPYLNLILTALFKMPSVTATVWRGVKAKLHHLYEKGKFYIWWPFTSCTLSMELLENPMYLGDSGDRTLFSIECFSGKAIKAYSYYQHEDEILLLPGTYLEVTGKAKIGANLYIIRMREVKPPHILLEPPMGFEQTQNIEFILDSVYEVNKENDDVPKLFIILPDPLHPWNRTDFEKNKFLLHFVCECSINETHLAYYPGYAIPYPRLFLSYYSRYIQQFMIPLGQHLFNCRRIDSIHNDEFWNIFMQGISEIQTILTELQNSANNFDITMVDTRQLPDFLSPFQRRGGVLNAQYISEECERKFFSNLCRSVTVDMVVRWVCSEHYPKDQLEAMYRLGTLVATDFDVIASNIQIYYSFEDADSILQFKDIVSLRIRCYYLHLRIYIQKDMMHLSDEIIEILGRIKSLSFGHISFGVMHNYKQDEDLSDQLLWRFIESNVHTKHIIAPIRLPSKVETFLEASITTLTLRSLSVFGSDGFKILHNKQFIKRLTPKLSSLSVQMSHFPTIVPNLCELIQSSKKLSQLDLSSRNSKKSDALNTDDLQHLCEAICANTTIKTLRIRCRMTDSDAPFLVNIIQSCFNLMSLTLEDTGFTEQGVSCIMKESGKSSSLLFLYFGKFESEEFIQGCPITRCLTAKSLLVTYSVSSVRICNNEIERLAENLKMNMVLSHLCLQNALTTDQVKCVVDALCFNSSLISLNLSNTRIGRLEAETIAELLDSKTSNLRMLYLRKCGLTDDITGPLLVTLVKNRRLTHLSLDKNNMKDGSANRIAAVIAVNVSLTCLSVKHNEWTVDGFEHMARSLRRNSILTEFYFGSYSYEVQDGRAVGAIYNALSRNTTIVRSSECSGAEEQRNLLLVKRPSMILV